MCENVRFGTWAAVGDDCPLAYAIDGDDNIELRFGERSSEFEVILTPAALERLVPLATAALAEARLRS